MKFFIDCEWNDYKGELLSMALVALDTDTSWYVELQYESELSDWVLQNVYPHLSKNSLTAIEARRDLLSFLEQYEGEPIEIIADWPEDIARFCDFLITGPGTCLHVDITRFSFSIHSCRGPHTSQRPHNALSDATANRANYLHSLINNEADV